MLRQADIDLSLAQAADEYRQSEGDAQVGHLNPCFPAIKQRHSAAAVLSAFCALHGPCPCLVYPAGMIPERFFFVLLMRCRPVLVVAGKGDTPTTQLLQHTLPDFALQSGQVTLLQDKLNQYTHSRNAAAFTLAR